MFGGDDNNDSDDQLVFVDSCGGQRFIEIGGDNGNVQVAGDMRDIAETIRDLVSGIDGEALADELCRLADEVECMDNPLAALGYEDPEVIIQSHQNRWVDTCEDGTPLDDGGYDHMAACKQHLKNAEQALLDMDDEE